MSEILEYPYKVSFQKCHLDNKGNIASEGNIPHNNTMIPYTLENKYSMLCRNINAVMDVISTVYPHIKYDKSRDRLWTMLESDKSHKHTQRWNNVWGLGICHKSSNIYAFYYNSFGRYYIDVHDYINWVGWEIKITKTNTYTNDFIGMACERINNDMLRVSKIGSIYYHIPSDKSKITLFDDIESDVGFKIISNNIDTLKEQMIQKQNICLSIDDFDKCIHDKYCYVLVWFGQVTTLANCVQHIQEIQQKRIELIQKCEDYMSSQFALKLPEVLNTHILSYVKAN